MAPPDVSGLDEEYLDRSPTGGWWLLVVLTAGFCGVFVADAGKGDRVWLVWALLALAVLVESVLRWRRPQGVRISTRGVSIRGGSSLVRPGRWQLHAWDDVVAVEVEDRRAFPSRLVTRSSPALALPGMPVEAAQVLERALEERQGRVRFT